LKILYSRIKEKYFNNNYVPSSDTVVFSWKRGQGAFGGWCRKGRKAEIRIGSIYKYAFERKTQSTSSMAVTDNFNEVRRRDLVDLMIHEMTHLRMQHHRKSFKNRVEEIKARVLDSDIPQLYEGLIKEV